MFVLNLCQWQGQVPLLEKQLSVGINELSLEFKCFHEVTGRHNNKHNKTELDMYNGIYIITTCSMTVITVWNNDK